MRLLTTVLLAPSTALAWPASGDWEELKVGTSYLVDVAEDMQEYNAETYLDLVGDAVSTAPVGYWYVDDTDLYFRIRVDADPGDGTYFASEGAWVVLIDNDGVLNTYEYSIAFSSDGAGTASLQVFSNAKQLGDADDPADNILWETSYSISGTPTAEISLASSAISLDADYYVDVTIPWADLETRTGNAFYRNIPFQITLATAEERDNAASVNVDIAAAEDFDELAKAWADSVGIDLDEDDLIYFEEVDTLGTDPNDADSDDDGLSDGDEVNTYGTDPLDCDSDDDGLPDGLELGVIKVSADTDTSAGCFSADADSTTTTNPLSEDTDGDVRPEWLEDVNQNGRVDDWESDPNIFDVDTDKDGIVDFIEDQCEDEAGSATDQDGDGIPDLDEGVDEDGFLLDEDGDGVPDFCDPISSGGDDTGGGSDDTGSGGSDDTGDTDDTDTDDTDTDDTDTDDTDTDVIDTAEDSGGLLGVCSVPFVCEGRLTGGSCGALPGPAALFPALLTMMVLFKRREDG